MKIKNLFKGEGFVNFSSSILAIVCGLLFGLIILLISNPSQAFGGFMMIIQGGFTDGMQGFGQVLYMATPLIMTGLSVGFAFKTGLFNIGASGQFTAGAFAAVYVGVKFTFLPPGVHCLAALLAAILAGALWGMVPGLLKAFFNVNEVISSIMMNYIGMYLTNMLIQNTVYDQVKKIPAVYYLELSSPRVAEIIGEETGAEPLLFHSCHNVTRHQFDSGVTYLELMEQNVKNLKKGLS